MAYPMLTNAVHIISLSLWCLYDRWLKSLRVIPCLPILFQMLLSSESPLCTHKTVFQSKRGHAAEKTVLMRAHGESENGASSRDVPEAFD